MLYLNTIYKGSEPFRTLADNSGLNAKKLFSFSSEMGECGNFCQNSLKFLDLLGKNKRFMYVNKIAEKYCKAYLMLTKEEKIIIISAHALNASQKESVEKALKENKENQGKIFIIDYQVQSSILGGLQMYTENRFMDLSLSSRVDKLKDEVNRLI